MVRITFGVILLNIIRVCYSDDNHLVHDSGLFLLEETLITSSKRDTSLTDYAGTASIVTDRDIDQLRLQDINDIAGFSNALETVDTGPSNPDYIIIRGLNTASIDDNERGGNGSTVARYLDNVAFQGYFSPPSIPLEDVVQIEVLKGPQGTLYGSASLSGLVRVLSKRPSLDYREVTIGTELSHVKHSQSLSSQGRLTINLPIIEDVWGVRLHGAYVHDSGFIDNNELLSGGQNDINALNSTYIKLSSLWQPSHNYDIQTTYHYHKTNVGDRQAVNSSYTDQSYESPLRYRQPTIKESHILGVDLSIELEDGWRIISSTGAHQYTNKQVSDQTDFLLTLDDRFDLDFYRAYPEFSAYTDSDFRVDTYSQEIRIQSPDESRFSWSLGTYAARVNFDGLTQDITPGFSEYIRAMRSDDIDYIATQNEVLDEYAIFGEVVLRVSENLTTSVGARRYRYLDDLTLCDAFPISDNLANESINYFCLQGSHDHLGYLFSSNLHYTLKDNVHFYGVVSEGFRRGGTNALPTDIQSSRDYFSDTSLNMEAGLRWFNPSVNLSVEAALFHIRWRALQLPATHPSGYGVIINAGDALSKGIELSATADISDEWFVKLGLTLTDATLRDTVYQLESMDLLAENGDRLPGAARYQGYIQLGYQLALKHYQLFGQLGLSYVGERIGELYESREEESLLESSYPVSVNIGVESEHWRASIFVSNLFDQYTVSATRGDDIYGQRGQFEVINTPRRVGVSVSFFVK